MIDEKNRIIYVDFSTLSKWRSCKELTRLSSVIGYRYIHSEHTLTFGHAFHAAWRAYYDALANGWHDYKTNEWHFFSSDMIVDPVKRAKAAFMRDLQYTGAELPINIESGERRSVERGLGLIDAYLYRYRDELYENILDKDGKPYTEVGFRIFVTNYDGYEIWLVGYIDRIMRSKMTGRPTIIEGKTTGSSLKVFPRRAKPNHQVTTYFAIARDLFPDIRECVWDSVFISTRQPDMKKAMLDRFWMWGIDVENDFNRTSTTRSEADIIAFKQDLENDALDYAKWLTSGIARWPRSAPEACHTYGGCKFRDRCSMNIEPEQEESYMLSGFKIDKWEPWKQIIREADNE